MLGLFIDLTVDFVVMCRLSVVGVDFLSVRDKRKVSDVLPGVASLPQSLRRWLSNQWSVAASSRTRWSQPMAKAEAKGSGKGRDLFNNLQRFGLLNYAKNKIHWVHCSQAICESAAWYTPACASCATLCYIVPHCPTSCYSNKFFIQPNATIHTVKRSCTVRVPFQCWWERRCRNIGRRITLSVILWPPPLSTMFYILYHQVMWQL